MDIYRTFLAIIISFLILIGYQYFFVGFGPTEPPVEKTVVQEQTTTPEAASTTQTNVAEAPAPASPAVAPAGQTAVAAMERPARDARKLQIDTNLYTATVSEEGGSITSFVLKDYKETNSDDSPGMQMVKVDGKQGYPLEFAWGSVAPAATFYAAENDTVSFNGDKAKLVMIGRGNGLEIERDYSFSKDSYLMTLEIRVKNVSSGVLQGAAVLAQTGAPFREAAAASRYLFNGPAYCSEDSLTEVKAKELEKGVQTVTAQMDWAAYEGTYFMNAVLPPADSLQTLTMQSVGEHNVKMTLAGNLDTLQPGEEKVYSYHLYFGPKKLDILESVGSNLEKAINFGWFDIIAQPTLMLLNFFHGIFKNYGIAIILVTIIFKAVFWPITQKGLKSMKNMQKLQPKMVKLKEKYKDDPAKMNQEVMNLYKTYKVNPLGGCLPMVLQIPVFFALYKVLLMCVELRHAPFMLWITDLSAPDRLYIGVDIPYVGGIPVLTLLMGASMFLQQKMTPTTADPTQAKIMMFLPVVFTFMFINFASGLVLYWFVNNLLAIFQQQMINRQKKA